MNSLVGREHALGFSPWLLNTDSVFVPWFSLFLSPGVLALAWSGSAPRRHALVCWVLQLRNWCVDQEHGKDDVTGETLVRRDDDQPEVSWLCLHLKVQATPCLPRLSIARATIANYNVSHVLSGDL